MADHVHDDDGGAVHGHEGRGHRDHIKMKDGLVSFGPGKTACQHRNDLVVGGTKSFLKEDPTTAGTRDVRRRLDDDVAANVVDGGEVMVHDQSQSNGDVAGIQSTSGENSPQKSGPPRSLDGDEIVDHVHGKGNGGALHDQ